jgi:branched-chain amino acid transport system permease protein
LRAAGLVKAFGGVIAVDGATLELRAGEILGVIGPNGSGKTTLVNLLSGLERPDAGTLFLADREVATWPSHRLATAGLARSFQSPHLVASMPVLDMVALAATAARGRGILGRTDGGEQLEALAILAELGLADLAQAPCGGLSQGQRRRVELARALALRPTVLLLDEPAAGLTPAEQSAFARELALLREDGMAMLVIEHSMPFLLPLVDRLICLDRGRILADGPVEDVRRDPAVIAAYLGTAR